MPFSFVSLLISIILFFAGTVLTGPAGFGKVSETRNVYYPPPAFFKYFSFGHDETLADIFWLRLVQDIDLCAQDFSNSDPNPNQLKAKVNERRQCELSWAFRMFDIITNLAPRFRMPHAVGGLTLSVLLDDYKGATYLFEKAVEAFPDDWAILYRASYHYIFDRNDLERGAELALLAVKKGAPEWLSYSAARLYTEAGRKDYGLKLLEDLLETEEGQKNREAILSKIEKLKSM